MGTSRQAAEPVSSSVKYSRLRHKQSSTRQRRHAVLLSFFWVLVLILFAAMVKYTVYYLGSHNTSGGSTAISTVNEQRLGRITIERGDRKCEHLEFDNDTGQIISSSKPCVAEVASDNGVPVPLGTMHRLDAISKSFSGR